MLLYSCNLNKEFTIINGGEGNMLTMFLTGIADLNMSYDVVRKLAFHFGFNSKTLGEILKSLLPF